MPSTFAPLSPSLTPPSERHARGHNRLKHVVDVQRQVCRRQHRLCHVLDLHRRLMPERPVGLSRSWSGVALDHRGGGVANFDLADGDVVCPAVEGGALREEEVSVR